MICLAFIITKQTTAYKAAALGEPRYFAHELISSIAAPNSSELTKSTKRRFLDRREIGNKEIDIPLADIDKFCFQKSINQLTING